MNRLYQWYRYYFVRKKAPLSWIWWHDVLRRNSTSVGMYDISLAALNQPDAGISLSCGAYGDNTIEITVYDGYRKPVEMVTINLSYRDAVRVMDGFERAFSISRRQIKKENEDTNAQA